MFIINFNFACLCSFQLNITWHWYGLRLWNYFSSLIPSKFCTHPIPYFFFWYWWKSLSCWYAVVYHHNRDSVYTGHILWAHISSNEVSAKTMQGYTLFFQLTACCLSAYTIYMYICIYATIHRYIHLHIHFHLWQIHMGEIQFPVKADVLFLFS